MSRDLDQRALPAEPAPPGAVSGLPLAFLRTEGAVLLAAALAAYVTALDEPLWLIPVLLLLPDVLMVGYLRDNRVGAWLYNLAHSYPVPASVGAAAVLTDAAVWQGVALIWFAHIGMDRAVGYGLKHESGFQDTHLGRIGR